MRTLGKAEAPAEHTAAPRAAAGGTSDVVDAAVILAFCAFAWWPTTGFDETPTFLAYAISPAAFPRLLLVILALLAIAMGWGALRRGERVGRPTLPGRTVVITVGLMIVYAMLFERLGAFLPMVPLCALMAWAWGERRLALVVTYALGFTLANWLIFVEVLRTPLPEGPLGF